jgi:predicted PurR-regulated permease PerM
MTSFAFVWKHAASARGSALIAVVFTLLIVAVITVPTSSRSGKNTSKLSIPASRSFPIIVVVNFVVEQVAMPRMMGSGLNMPPSVIFFAFFFWAWLLGVGLIFVPLNAVGLDVQIEDIGRESFFRKMKELTVVGYYTSEVGQTQELRLTPWGRYRDVSYKPGTPAWA